MHWRGRCRRWPRPMRSRSSSSRPRATPSRTGRCREAGGKGLFVKEIEEAMLARRIDIAVHSMKDMPTAQPAGPGDRRLPGARGCARRADRGRRQAHRRSGRKARWSAPRRCGGAPSSCIAGPTCKIVTLRGNVDTRLRKREAGEVEATILALAGLKRLGLGTCRRAGARGRDAARRRPGRDLHRMPRGRCADARLARRHRPWPDGDVREGRARDARPCSTVRAARRLPVTRFSQTA